MPQLKEHASAHLVSLSTLLLEPVLGAMVSWGPAAVYDLAEEVWESKSAAGLAALQRWQQGSKAQQQGQQGSLFPGYEVPAATITESQAAAATVAAAGAGVGVGAVVGGAAVGAVVGGAAAATTAAATAAAIAPDSEARAPDSEAAARAPAAEQDRAAAAPNSEARAPESAAEPAVEGAAAAVGLEDAKVAAAHPAPGPTLKEGLHQARPGDPTSNLMQASTSVGRPLPQTSSPADTPALETPLSYPPPSLTTATPPAASSHNHAALHSLCQRFAKAASVTLLRSESMEQLTGRPDLLAAAAITLAACGVQPTLEWLKVVRTFLIYLIRLLISSAKALLIGPFPERKPSQVVRSCKSCHPIVYKKEILRDWTSFAYVVEDGIRGISRYKCLSVCC